MFVLNEKDHFSIVKFPTYNPAIINIIFAVIAGFSSMVFGKLGDVTVNKIDLLLFIY